MKKLTCFAYSNDLSAASSALFYKRLILRVSLGYVLMDVDASSKT